MERDLGIHRQIEDALSSWLQQTGQYLEASNHEDDEAGDIVREVLRETGSHLTDRQIKPILSVIGHLCDVLEAASDARGEDNPALAGELGNLAQSLGSALHAFSASDASDAVITRVDGVGDL